MPNLTASIPHQLGRAEAKRRIQDGLAQARQQHAALLGAVQETWTGDRLAFSVSAMGQTVTGHLDVDDQAVHVDVVLPLFLAMLSGTVKQAIEQQGRRLLTGPKPAP